MGRFTLACRVFLAALTDAAARPKLTAALAGPALPEATAVEKTQRPLPLPETVKLGRSEALTLLAALQREARFIDLVKQPLTEFSDEQIGAASRNVLADCRTVLDRFFEIQPLLSDAEGTACEVPTGYDPANYKLSGSVAGSGPFRGQLVHHGWRAKTVNLPTWTGAKGAERTLAPAEVEVG